MVDKEGKVDPKEVIEEIRTKMVRKKDTQLEKIYERYGKNPYMLIGID